MEQNIQSAGPQDVGPAMARNLGPIVAGATAAGTAGLAGEIPGIANALLQHAEEKAAEWATQYPHLIKLAGALGVHASTAAVLGWLDHSSKSK